MRDFWWSGAFVCERYWREHRQIASKQLMAVLCWAKSENGSLSKNSSIYDEEDGNAKRGKWTESVLRGENGGRIAAFNLPGLTSWRMPQNSLRCFPTQITQIILQIPSCYFSGCECQLSFCRIRAKKALCANCISSTRGQRNVFLLVKLKTVSSIRV